MIWLDFVARVLFVIAGIVALVSLVDSLLKLARFIEDFTSGQN